MAQVDLLVGTDQNLTVTGLKQPDGTFLNSATVEATIYEADGVTEVTGQSWPLTLSYQAASDGEYKGVINDTLNVVVGNYYYILVTATQSGVTRSWRNEALAQYDSF